MKNFISDLTQKVLDGEDISSYEAERLLNIDQDNFLNLLAGANSIRRFFQKDKVELCAITNAKSGGCSEDCKFCSQSAFYHTQIKAYPLLSETEIFNRARKAERSGARRFCIVTSGHSLSDREFDIVCRSVSLIRQKLKILPDASLGQLNSLRVKRLKKAGLSRYNHNIETAPSFFRNICTTHTISERLETIKLIKEYKLELCCGGIIGLGENLKQRLEFAFTLKKLDVDCVALNFLNPISGTKLENRKIPQPLKILKLIAVFRFILPKKEIKICGGRQRGLRSLQSLLFFAGGNSLITGDYLTTRGSPPQEDLQMIRDLELDVL